MRKRILITMALASLLLAGNAFACPNKHGVHTSKSQMHGSKRGHSTKHVVKKVIAAVSQTGIDAEQTQQVTAAINTFKATNMKIKASKKMPLDAFKDDGFDKKAFMITVMAPQQAKAMAKADLLESVYGILDAEQKKIFKRACTSSMIEKSIKKGMVKGHMMKNRKSCGKCQHAVITDVEVPKGK